MLTLRWKLNVCELEINAENLDFMMQPYNYSNQSK